MREGVCLSGEDERRSSYRALIVEDDGAILKLVKIVLERENFTVEGVRTGQRQSICSRPWRTTF